MKHGPVTRLFVLIGLAGIAGGCGTINESPESATAGVRSPAPRAEFILGADISSLPERIDQGVVFVDTYTAKKADLAVFDRLKDELGFED